MKKTLLVVLAVIGLARACHAGVTEASDSIMTAGLLQGINAVARANRAVPATLGGSNVYLCVTAGGGYTDVRVFAPPAVAPDKLAQDLAQAARGTALNGHPVTWENAGYSGAAISERHGRLWQQQVTNDVAVRDLELGLEERGYTPHLILRTPLPASVRNANIRPVATIRRIAYYDRRALKGLPAVVLSTTVASDALVILALLLVMPAALSAFFLALQYRVSQSEGLTPEARARKILAYQTRAFVAPFVVQIPLALVAVVTGVLSSVTDVWFGTPLLRPIPPFFITGFVPMLVLLMTVRSPAVTREAGTGTPDDRKIRQQVALAQGFLRFISSMLIVCVAFVNVSGNPFLRWFSPAGEIAALLVTAGLLQLYAGGLKKYIDCRPDSALTMRLRRVGERCGVSVKTVFRDRGSRHKFCIVRRSGHIVITDGLAESITDDELVFVMTRARINHSVKMARVLGMRPKFPWTPLVLIGAFWWVQASGLFAPPLVVLLAIGYLVILLKDVSWCLDDDEPAQRLKALELDRKALEQTKSLEAAISAIRKITMIEDVFPSGETSTAMRKSGAARKTPGPLREERIRNLQEAASEMDIR